jgi:hypothetical protein
MRSQSMAVLRIYWARASSSLVGGVVAVIAGALLATALALSIMIALDPRGNHRYAIEQIWVLTMLGLGGMTFILWFQFQDMVVGESQSLWPGYRKPNLIVFVAVAALMFIGLPGAISYLDNLHSWALLSLAMALFSLNGWRTATKSLIVQFGFFGLLMGFWMVMTAYADRGMLSLPNPVAIGIIFVSILVATASCAKLLRTTNENRIFRNRTLWNTDLTRSRMTGDVNQVWSESQRGKLFGWPSSRHQVYLPKTDSLWDGARRWRSLNAGVLVFTLGMAVMMTAIAAMPRIMFYRQQASWRAIVLQHPQLAGVPAPMPPNIPQTGSFILLMYLAVFPVIGVGQSWVRQWRFLELESLRSIARDQFLGQIGLAIAIQMFQAWAIFAGALMLDAVVVELGPVNVAGLVVLLAGSLGAVALGYSLLAWSLRYRASAFGAVFFCGMTATAFMGLVALGINSQISVSPYFEIIPLLLAVGGVYVGRIAFRRWLLTDLG